MLARRFALGQGVELIATFLHRLPTAGSIVFRGMDAVDDLRPLVAARRERVIDRVHSRERRPAMRSTERFGRSPVGCSFASER
jgi:hypothetical protein